MASREDLILTLSKVLIAAAWADGELTHDEVNSMKDLLFHLPQLSARQWASLQMYIESPVGDAERERLLEELKFAIRTPRDRQLAQRALEEMLQADGEASAEEEQVAAEVRAAIESVSVDALSRLVKDMTGRRAQALAHAPNREAYFDDFVKNKVYYGVRRRLDLGEAELHVGEDVLRTLSLAGGIMAQVARVNPQISDAEVDGIQFERVLAPGGANAGVVLRPSDGRSPKEVVFISCVGSRDPEHGVPYCSRVCCMYLAKQAMLYKHAVPDGQAYIFYMDTRSTGKGYEEFIQRAVEEDGVLYLRGRVSKVFRDGEKLKVWGADTLTGKKIELSCDLVVLAMAMVPNPAGVELMQRLGIKTDIHGFITEFHYKLRPLETSIPGIYIAGTAQGPRDIPDSVAQGSGAASKVLTLFSAREPAPEKVEAS